MKLKIGKNEVPFRNTDKQAGYLKAAHVNLKLVGISATETKRFAYLTAKAACEEDGLDFSYNWETFISFVEQDCMEKSKRLLYEKKKAAKKSQPDEVKKPEGDE